MHRILNTTVYIALALALAAEAGHPISGLLTAEHDPDLCFKIGFALLLTAGVIQTALHLKCDHVDLIGAATGEFRWTTLLALPVIAIGIFHIASGNLTQGAADFDFAGFLAFFGMGITAADAFLPPPAQPRTLRFPLTIRKRGEIRAARTSRAAMIERDHAPGSQPQNQGAFYGMDVSRSRPQPHDAATGQG